MVDRARSKVEDADDAEAVAAGMVDLLAEREPAQIVAFAQPLWDLLSISYRNDLWAAAYVMCGGASDDGFDYFRGWLIAQGREVFERSLADPDSLAALPVVIVGAAEGRDDFECADVLSVAWDAYRRVTGGQLPSDAFTTNYPNLDPDWNFDFDDQEEMRRRLPRLTALFYG